MTFHLHTASGNCLDVAQSNPANGTTVQAWGCNSSPAQQWRPTDQGWLQNAATNKCLDVDGNNGPQRDGTRVQIYDCNGTASQHWQWSTTNGLTRLYNVGSTLCLDLHTSDWGQAAQVWDCNGTGPQQFDVQQDNTGTGSGEQNINFPKQAEFDRVRNELPTTQQVAKAQWQITQQQAAIAQQAADATVQAQQQAYAIADAAGAPRGRALLAGQQQAQVTLATAAALTAATSATGAATDARASAVAAAADADKATIAAGNARDLAATARTAADQATKDATTAAAAAKDANTQAAAAQQSAQNAVQLAAADQAAAQRNEAAQQQQLQQQVLSGSGPTGIQDVVAFTAFNDTPDVPAWTCSFTGKVGDPNVACHIPVHHHITGKVVYILISCTDSANCQQTARLDVLDVRPVDTVINGTIDITAKEMFDQALKTAEDLLVGDIESCAHLRLPSARCTLFVGMLAAPTVLKTGAEAVMAWRLAERTGQGLVEAWSAVRGAGLGSQVMARLQAEYDTDQAYKGLADQLQAAGKLGPSSLSGEVTELTQGYRPFGNLSREEFVEKYWDPDKVNWNSSKGNWRYPPDDGVVPGTVHPVVPKVGDLWDRFGDPEFGKYLSPEGTSYSERAIPPSNLSGGYHVYQWLKVPDAAAGEIMQSEVAPWFEQAGGGIQFQTTQDVRWLLDHFYLKEVH